MFKISIITKTPTGRFHFVGRVHADLRGVSFDTIEDAKAAAIDVMMKIGETFPVDVQSVD